MKRTITAAQPLTGPATAARGAFARLRAVLADAPVRGEARRRIRGKPGFFASLSPEALDYVRGYRGPENMGPS